MLTQFCHMSFSAPLSEACFHYVLVKYIKILIIFPAIIWKKKKNIGNKEDLSSCCFVSTNVKHIYIYIYTYIYTHTHTRSLWVFWKIPKVNSYIVHTTTTLFCRLTYHLTNISSIKQHLMTKHNKVTDKVKSFCIRNILINNTKIMYKNNNKNRLQISKAISMKNTKTCYE